MHEEQELVNIIDQFVLPPKKEFIISEEDELDLIESESLLIEELVQRNPMAYIYPNFHESIVAETFEMLLQVFDENSTILLSKEDIAAEEERKEELEDRYVKLETTLQTIIAEAMNLFYTHIAPRRSYRKTFIRANNSQNFAKLEEQIEYLKSVPQPDQRTTEWYAFRYRYLTASNIWKAFISQSTKNQLIYEKCQPLLSADTRVVTLSVNTETPMHWGNKYEPVSVALYEQKYRTTVSEFGCIPHKSIPFIAASPDGINTDKSSSRYGRMLEVKNIVNREINGNPKMEYWVQMQLQLEVCDLKECDFLETRFVEYENEEEFMADSLPCGAAAGACEAAGARQNPFLAIDEKQKGIIMYFINNGKPHYEYYIPDYYNVSAETTPLDHYKRWEETMMAKNEANMWIKNLYWKLDQFSCVLVLRNKFWFNAAKPALDDIWHIIEKERVEGFAHRAPNKRVPSLTSAASQKKKMLNMPTDIELPTKICYITMAAINAD